MNRLLYISYGRGLHEHEVIFSLATAKKWGGSDWRAVILTDHPESFAGIDADVEFVSSATWDDWAGPHQFAHRRKILALQHAFEAEAVPTVLVDGDTWFRGGVSKVFDRIAPGRTVMHIREGAVSHIRSPLMSKMTKFLDNNHFDAAEEMNVMSSTSQMWNAGVVGLHPDDSGLLEKVLQLTDQFCEQSDLHVLEQFAFSWLLSQQSQLAETSDLIFHYWPPYLHQPFRGRVAEIMKSAKDLPEKERAEYLFANRPRPTTVRRAKVVAKRIGQLLGLIRGRCRSNEW